MASHEKIIYEPARLEQDFPIADYDRGEEMIASDAFRRYKVNSS